jgi:tetratricopeptide (TPR) repeat protein
LAAASCVVTYHAQRSLGAIGSLDNVTLAVRVGNALLAYVGYLGKTIWPTGLSVFYPLDVNLSPADAFVAGVVLATVTIALTWRARSNPWLVTGWFWYLGTLVPVIGLVQVGVAQAMADRYTYLPLVGLSFMLCWSVPDRAMERRAQQVAVVAAGLVWLGVYALMCRVQLCYWNNSETLFRHALQVTRDNYVAHNSLGLALGRSAHFPEAIEQYNQALQINPRSPEAHNNLGFTLIQLGKVNEAVHQFEQALQANPDYVEAHYNLGLALTQLGKPEEAIAHYKEVLRINPDHLRALSNMGVALVKLGKTRQAIAQYQRALLVEPDYPEANNNLAWLLATLAPADGGDPGRAVTLAQKAYELTGNRVAGYLDTLAVAYAAAGRFNDAIATAQKAIGLARAAGQSQLAAEIQGHLESYREGRPVRPSQAKP